MSKFPKRGKRLTPHSSKESLRGSNRGIGFHPENNCSMNTHELFFGLELMAKRNQRSILPTANKERFARILQTLTVRRDNIVKPYMYVILEITAHQVVFVADAIAIDTVRSQQDSRAFNSSTTNDIEPGSRCCSFPRKGFDLDPLNGCSCLVCN